MMNKLILGCLVSASLMAVARAENVILISVDTLRADRLSCYGYQFNSTPNIDRWAREGVLFEHVSTECPLTLPAHSTLFTGTYPFSHGVRENIGFVLPEESVALAEVFKENGYATGAFLGSYVLASKFGVGQGFETFDEDFGSLGRDRVRGTAIQRPAGQVTGKFLEWLSRHRQEKFFAFVHFYDPHTPRPYGYDWEVSAVDRSIGQIHEYLEKNGLLGETHIILTSDHGESLDEHGESGHGFFLYQSTLHVPLIIRPAARLESQQARIGSSVSLADVMPTILDLAELEAPADIQGRSLLRSMLGKHEEERGTYAETYVPQLHFGWSPLRSYRLGRYKFIDAPRPELYDLVNDPNEKDNLFSSNRTMANRLGSQIEEFVGRYSATVVDHASNFSDRETLENLAALGYVSFSRTRPRDTFGEGIDPKDRIKAFELFHRILNEVDAGRYSAASPEQMALLRREAPEMRGLSYLEAQAYEKQGRTNEALESYLKAEAEDSGNLLAKSGVARMLMSLGRHAEAEKAFRELLLKDPGDYRSRTNLAGVLMLQGNPGASETELLKALETSPRYEVGWQNLARLYGGTSRWEEAEGALRKALELNSNDAGTHLLLSRVLSELGRAEEAARERQIAIELDPRLRR